MAFLYVPSFTPLLYLTAPHDGIVIHFRAHLLKYCTADTLQRMTCASLAAQHGFCLSSLGVLFTRSLPPRHLSSALKALVREPHSSPACRDVSNFDVWTPAWRFFELLKARRADLGSPGARHRWIEELYTDDGGVEEGELLRLREFSVAITSYRFIPTPPRCSISPTFRAC